MTNEDLGKIQDEITRHLEAFHLPSMHVTALAGLLLADVVEPAIRAERERCAARICPGCRAGYPFERDGRDHRTSNGYAAGCAAYAILHS